MLKSLFGFSKKAASFHAVMTPRGQAAWSGRDYLALCEEGFRQNAIAHRCVRLIAESCAAIPIAVKGEGQAQTQARALLNEPNLDQTGPELLESFYGFLHMAGNAYLNLATSQNGGMQIFALRPDRVQVLPDEAGWTRGWRYQSGSSTQDFTRDELSGASPILHLKLFHPCDDHYGLPPLEAAARAVDIHNAGGVWAKALLDNGARPSGALVMSARDGGDASLSAEQFARLKAEMEAQYAGPDNAGRPMVLEGGLDWKPMAMSPADMDYIEARREAAREIALAFGIPPLLLGLPGDNTYSNYKEANLAFYRQTVLPLVRKTARALQSWLRPWVGADLSLTVIEDGLSALSEERRAHWQRLGAADFLDRDEKRAMAGIETQS